MAAMVNKEKCIGCGRCEDICPAGAIKIEDGKAAISDACVECGACVGECPNEAISLYTLKEDLIMPGKDGTGPLGRGPVAGRGAGRRGQCGRRGQRGVVGTGPAGYCRLQRENHTHGGRFLHFLKMFQVQNIYDKRFLKEK